MSISPDKAWTNFTSGTGSGALASNAIQPVDGAIVVAAALANPNITLSVTSDTFGDSGGGSWQTAVSINATSGGLAYMYLFWRVIGTGAASGTVSVTPSASSFREISIASFSTTGTNWAIDGTATKNDVTNNTGTALVSGDFITTMTDGLIVGFSSNGVNNEAAGTGYTAEKNTFNNNADTVYDNNIAGTITATAGTNNVQSVSGLSNRFFGMVAAAWKVDVSGGGTQGKPLINSGLINHGLISAAGLIG